MKTTKNVPTEPWTKTPPTEQGWYWHWTGDEDCAPFPLNVLWSGASRKCFVSAIVSHSHGVGDCDEYGGWWLQIKEPKIPTDLLTQFDSPLMPSEKCVPIVLYFGSDGEADAFVTLVRKAVPSLVSSKL